MRPGKDGIPFFLIHGWGGGITGYADLARSLDPKWPIYGIQAVGLLGEKPPDASIEAMVDRYITAIKSVHPNGPYRLGGYCTGGQIAYAISCSLRKQGDDVELVAIIDGNAPGITLTHPPVWSPKRISCILKSLPFWLVDYKDLGLAGVWQRLRKKLRFNRFTKRKLIGAENYVVEDVILDNPTQLPDYQMNLLVTELNAISKYKPENYDGQVDVITSRYPTISQAINGPLDPFLGWDRLVRGKIKRYEVRSAHRNIHLPPYCFELADYLQDELKRADGKNWAVDKVC
jgi:thioesterase domain-containing protein